MSALLITGLRLSKEHVLTPRGRDMNPVLGPVVTVSPGSKLSYLGAGGNVIFKLVRKGRGLYIPAGVYRLSVYFYTDLVGALKNHTAG
jgi:hypothetical protein